MIIEGYNKLELNELGVKSLILRTDIGRAKENSGRAKLFNKMEGANIKTNTEAARVMIKNTNLDSDESIIFLHVKKLYTNVPLKDVINIALKTLNSQNELPDLSRSTRKRFLFMAVSNVHFKCNKKCYGQKGGLAMGASLAVMLANLWLKDYENFLDMDIPQKIDILEDMIAKCPKSKN